MKSLIIIFFALLFSSIAFGQKLSARDSIETMANDDIFAVQLDSSSTYTWRKVFYSDLLAQFTLVYPALGTANTFTGINTFNTHIKSSSINPRTDDTYYAGWGLFRYTWLWARKVYTEEVVIINPSDSQDSTNAAKWTYDGTNLTADKPLQLGDNLGFDSSYAMKNTVYNPSVYAIANTGDSVLTINADSCALIELSLPGNVTNLENIIFDADAGDGLGEGAVIRIWHKALNTVFFEDAAALDAGSMQLAGDFTMAIYDYLELLHVYTGTFWTWVEVSRSNN